MKSRFILSQIVWMIATLILLGISASPIYIDDAVIVLVIVAVFSIAIAINFLLRFASIALDIDIHNKSKRKQVEYTDKELDMRRQNIVDTVAHDNELYLHSIEDDGEMLLESNQ